MGEIETDMLQPLNLEINAFCIHCKKNLTFLSQFRDHVDSLEKDFIKTWGSDEKLNNYFFKYEKDVLTDYLVSLNS